MARLANVEKLPSDVKHWLINSILDGTYDSYDALCSSLKDKGYEVSRSALARFGKKLRSQSEDNKSRIEEIRMRCLELAEGTTPENRIAIAEQYLDWVFRSKFPLRYV